jgi:hypothetical protein
MILRFAIAALCDLGRVIIKVTNAAEVVIDVAGAVASDVRTHVRRELARVTDRLLHGAPCECCWQDDCEAKE